MIDTLALQTDLTFPLRYKNYIFNESPSNVIALAKFIEATRPELVYPVHNASMSGAYFFMTRYFGDKFKKKNLVTIIVPSFRQSLLLGELRRLLIESPRTRQNVKLLDDVENKIADRIEFVEKNSEIKTFPVRKLVQLQLGCLLLCLKYF